MDLNALCFFASSLVITNNKYNRTGQQLYTTLLNPMHMCTHTHTQQLPT